MENARPWKLLFIPLNDNVDTNKVVVISEETLKYRAEVNIQVVVVLRNKSQLNKERKPCPEWLVPIAEKSVGKTLMNILRIQIENTDVDILEDFLQQIGEDNIFKEYLKLSKMKPPSTSHQK